MTNRLTKELILSLLLIIPMSSLGNDRPFERDALMYHEKLMQGKFEELDSDARYARATNATISDGQPLLSVIYGGVSGCEDMGCSFPDNLPAWEEKEKMLEKWLTLHPESVTAQIGYAGYFIQLGWFHRGGGYAKTVPEESWKIFKENIDKARVLLESHSEDIKSDAGWSFAMLEVALTQGWPDQAFNEIYNAAVTSHPSYVPLYFQKASYMEPKWHGSLDKFNDYVDSVVQETQPILGNQMYARLHWSGSQSNLFRSGRTDWKKMKLGFDELVLNHPDMWNINNFARFACLAKDIEKLTELIKIINEKPLLAAWRNSIGYYSWCVELVKRNSTNGS